MATGLLNQYITRGKDSIEGWFSRCDAEIFTTILTAQKEMNINGAVAEIGVHHGKSGSSD